MCNEFTIWLLADVQHILGIINVIEISWLSCIKVGYLLTII